MPPEVSVIVLTWNGCRYLEACLEAVALQQGVEAEILLVDNASTDGTVEFVRSRFPDVRVVALDENRGFAGGNNAGALRATGRDLVFLNNDTIVEPGWLAALRGGVDAAGGVLLTTSRVVYMHDPDVLDSAGDGFFRAGGAFKHLHGQRASAAPSDREVFGVCGAACLIRRALFEELGGFDEDFFASHEDVDLSYRARLRGYRCRYVAGAVVRHHGSATLGRMSTSAIFYGQRNLEWLYLKNTPFWLIVRTLPAHLLYDVAAALYFTRAGRLGAFLRAKAAAARGLPSMLRKRTGVQRARRVGVADLLPHLERRWLRIKSREKRFDLRVAG
jgi:GT2 family glycosyltransferase